MLGLANLFYIDPEDMKFVLNWQLCIDFAQAILRCPEANLEEFWSSDLGDRYWAIVRSGIQKEPLTPDSQSLKDQITQKLSPSLGGGFGQPGAINAMLVAMLFFEPGTMQVNGAAEKLPNWLLPGYQDIFAKPLNSST